MQDLHLHLHGQDHCGQLICHLDAHHSGPLVPQLSGQRDPHHSGPLVPLLSGQLDLGDSSSWIITLQYSVAAS